MTNSTAQAPRCVGCGRAPEEISEYVEMAQIEGYATPRAFVEAEEGTFNPDNGHFYCTDDYIAAGMPLGVAP